MKKTIVLDQFKALIQIGEVTSAARIYWDWAYMLRTELNDILATSDEVIAKAVKDHVTGMSGDYVDQP